MNARTGFSLGRARKAPEIIRNISSWGPMRVRSRDEEGFMCIYGILEMVRLRPCLCDPVQSSALSMPNSLRMC